MTTDNTEAICRIGRQVIENEAVAVQAALDFIDDAFVQAVELIHERVHSGNSKVVVTGMGKSGLIGKKIAATLSSTGTLAVFLHPAEGMHGDLGMVAPNDVVLAISKSGASDEVVGMYPALQRIGASIIALVSDTTSYMAKHADIVLRASVDAEASQHNLAPTTSTTVALVMGDALAVTLSEMAGFQPEDFALLHPAGRLGKRLTLRLEDIMHGGEELPKCLATANMREVLREMSSKGMGCVHLVDDDGKLAGLITDGDLRRMLERHADAGGSLLDQSPIELATKQPKTMLPETLAYTALVEMEHGQRQFNHVPVVTSEGKLVGLVRVHDLVRAGL